MDVRLTKDIRIPVRDPQLAQIKIDKFLGVRVGQMAPDFKTWASESGAWESGLSGTFDVATLH